MLRPLLALFLLAACADPVATPPLEEEDGGIESAPDGGSECPRGAGTYCGSTFGGQRNLLYTCSAGKYVAVDRCAGECLVSEGAAQDKCGCPTGDGVYCGAAVG